jgi:muramoyltetrapeptide carboxypeptidase LdcA involved in peptidoglycan recycling
MLDCEQNKDQGYRLEEVVLRVVGGLGCPWLTAYAPGHVSGRNITLPFGVQAALDVSAAGSTLKYSKQPRLRQFRHGLGMKTDKNNHGGH